jgi:hypothetical protein
MNILSLTPTQLFEELPFIHEAELVPFLLASPGNAKSSALLQYSQAINRPFVDTRLSYKGPQDVLGWPTVRDGKMVFLTPDEYPTEEAVWCFEELTQVPPQVQAPALELMLNRRLGQYVVPKGTLLCATGNLLQDKAHVQRIGSALMNRMLLIRLEVPSMDWIEWAKKSGIDPRVYTYIKFAPQHLSDFDPSKWDGQSAFSSLRSWEAVSRYVKASGGVVRSSTHGVIAGLVSAAAAMEFTEFLKVFGRIPTIEGIILDPKGTKIPQKLDERLAVCSSIIGAANEKNFKRLLPYLERMPKELEVFTVKACKSRCEAIQATEEYILWMDRNQEIVLNS